MNHLPTAHHMPQNFRNQSGRRHNEYPYPPGAHHHVPPPPPLLPQQQPLPPHHLAYPGYVQPQQYYGHGGPLPMHHFPPPQYHQPYQVYSAPNLRPYHQQSPLIVSSHPHAQPVVPMTRQPLQQQFQPNRTPQPEIYTPSTISQNIASPSTTPTTTSVLTSTPPVSSVSKVPPAAPPATSPIKSYTATPVQREPFYPNLPWFSVPEIEFPPKVPRRRRRRKGAETYSHELQLPSRLLDDSVEDLEETSPLDTPRETSTVAVDALVAPLSPPIVASSDPAPLSVSNNTSSAAVSPTVPTHKRSSTKPVIPAVPLIPVNRAPPRSSIASPPVGIKPSPVDPNKTPEQKIDDTTSSLISEIPVATSPPIKPPPKSWAELFRAKGPSANSAAVGPSSASGPANGSILPGDGSLADMLRLYSVETEGKLSFIEPRGLVNTGNMCYMNSILQVLIVCAPFYDFLDQISKRAVHNFKFETPLIEAMIMFMREYPVIDAAVSAEQLRLRLKDYELEQYGEPLIPEYVYDVIKRLPRFSTMRRGHQQDAEEFLGFLLEGLHDECVHVVKKAATDHASANSLDPVASPTSERSEPELSAENGWMEVGPKQKASVTRSSGVIVTESPVTKIFGGKLRSVLRVPGLKDSVTLEPYQPLQLDIGAPDVYNITDALKGLTRLETLHGEFNSPRGPGTAATKQVFIETLPPVLILHLKRFQYDNTGGTQKIWKKVGYPLELEIPKEVFPQSQRANLSLRPGGMPKYRLTAAVYHHGKNASGGHYTVDVRRQEGREWMRIDDTFIRRIRSDDVAFEGSEEDPKTLAKALEQHERDVDAGKNIYKTPGFGSLNNEEGEDGKQEEEESKGGWSQVNGHSTSPAISATTTKKWSNVANGAITPKSNISGKQTPRGGAGSKSSLKDNKVAYILFYQRIKL